MLPLKGKSEVAQGSQPNPPGQATRSKEIGGRAIAGRLLRLGNTLLWKNIAFLNMGEFQYFYPNQVYAHMHIYIYIQTVDGCEILHHQFRMVETLEIMGCLPPINWWISHFALPSTVQLVTCHRDSATQKASP